MVPSVLIVRVMIRQASTQEVEADIMMMAEVDPGLQGPRSNSRRAHQSVHLDYIDAIHRYGFRRNREAGESDVRPDGGFME